MTNANHQPCPVFHSRSEGSADLGEPLKSQLNCSKGGTVHAAGQDFAVYQVNNKQMGFEELEIK